MKLPISLLILLGSFISPLYSGEDQSLFNDTLSRISNPKRDIIIPAEVEIPKDIDAADHLTNAKSYAKRFFNPLTTMKSDVEHLERFIYLEKGEIFTQGKVTLEGKFLFIDGYNPVHFDWVRAQNSDFKVVIVRGDDRAGLREHMKDQKGLYTICPMKGRDFYFDLYGALFQEVGVEKLPSRVTQVGNQILVEEIPIGRKLPHELRKQH